MSPQPSHSPAPRPRRRGLPAALAALAVALGGSAFSQGPAVRAPFKVTVKGEVRDRVTVQWPLFLLFMAIAAEFVTGMLLNYLGLHNAVDLGDMTALNVAWSLYSLLVVLLCALACVEFPKGRDYVNPRAEVLHSSVGSAVRALLTRLLG